MIYDYFGDHPNVDPEKYDPFFNYYGDEGLAYDYFGDHPMGDEEPNDTLTEATDTGLSLTNPGIYTFSGSGNNVGSYDLSIETIGPTNENSAPTDLVLSNNTIDENVAGKTALGTFSTTDPDIGDIFTYSLVSGTGDTDNGRFDISEDQLIINSSSNYESQSSYSILVQTTDGSGASYQEQLTMNVNNINEAPTALNLSNTAINENEPANSVVGTFSTNDPDNGDTFTYELVAGKGDTDNQAFSINDDQLTINSSPDYENKSSYSIRVKTTDGEGESLEQQLSINVNDINEPPRIAQPIILHS